MGTVIRHVEALSLLGPSPLMNPPKRLHWGNRTARICLGSNAINCLARYLVSQPFRHAKHYFCLCLFLLHLSERPSFFNSIFTLLLYLDIPLGYRPVFKLKKHFIFCISTSHPHGVCLAMKKHCTDYHQI